MKYLDISHDQKNFYILKENEKVVFFMLNRSDDITFTLAGEHAEAYVFALFTPTHAESIEQTITHVHTAPHTFSSFIGKGVLRDQSSIAWKGLIHIKKNAVKSNARQEMRSLLLSPEVSVSSIPSLEIENNDVHCGHAATASAPNAEQLFFLTSRGLSEKQAEQLIVDGFIQTIFDEMKKLVSPDDVEGILNLESGIKNLE